jgi:hypothetical protein
MVLLLLQIVSIIRGLCDNWKNNGGVCERNSIAPVVYAMIYQKDKKIPSNGYEIIVLLDIDITKERVRMLKVTN